MQAEVAVGLIGFVYINVCINLCHKCKYMLTILCREEPAKCRDVANSNSADTTTQCETYELAEFGEEYEMIPAFKGGQQVQGQQDSATQNVSTL